jgi:hypothetical protein
MPYDLHNVVGDTWYYRDDDGVFFPNDIDGNLVSWQETVLCIRNADAVDTDDLQELVDELEKARAELRALNASLISEDHLINFTEDGWTLQHPLSCRPNLFTCRVNKLSSEQITEPPTAGLGTYAIEVQNDVLILGRGSVTR